MPPSGSDGIGPKPPHLRVVPPVTEVNLAGDTSSQATSTAQNQNSEPPPSQPPKGRDLSGIERWFQRNRAPDQPFSLIQDMLAKIANPTQRGGFDVSFFRDGKHYRYIQATSGEPIEVTFSQETTPRNDPNPQFEEIWRFTYTQETDKNRLTKAQTGREHIAQELLVYRAEEIGKSRRAFERMLMPLQRLAGRTESSKGAVIYDNIVVHKGKVYSIRIQNLGFQAFESTRSQSQIVVTETGDAGATREVLTLSATGEVSHDPKRAERRIVDYDQIDLIKALTKQLQLAARKPEAYQRRLEQRLARFNQGRTEQLPAPTIKLSLGSTERGGTHRGPNGEPILTLEKGWPLLKAIRPWWLFRGPGYRWVNPNDPTDIRTLRPRGAMRFYHLPKEYTRWAWRTSMYWIFGRIRNVQPRSGEVQLTLLPEGGSELAIYRPNGGPTKEPQLFNLIRQRRGKPNVNLGRVARGMGKNDPEFKGLPRHERIMRAAQHIRSPDSLGVDILVQEVPPFEVGALREMHFLEPPPTKPGTNRPTQEIVDAPKAWEALQRLPQLQGLEFRVSSFSERGLVETIFGPAQTDLIRAEVPGSQPPTSFQVRSGTIPSGDKSTKRVEVQVWRGDNHYAVVYDNGRLNESASVETNQVEQNRAMEGHVPRHLLTRGIQSLTRTYNYAKGSGVAYAIGHYGTIPLVKGFEFLFFNDTERAAIGTPWPEASLGGFFKVWGGFMAMLGASGTAAMTVDGLLNYPPGIASTFRNWNFGRNGATLPRTPYPPF